MAAVTSESSAAGEVAESTPVPHPAASIVADARSPAQGAAEQPADASADTGEPQSTAPAQAPVPAAQAPEPAPSHDHASNHAPGATEVVQPLPPVPKDFAGSSHAAGVNFKVVVSNKAGYMCHVHVLVDWPCDPTVPFQIFSYPDNSKLFRDIKRVGTRKVMRTEPGLKEVQVEQIGEIKILWITRTYSTWIHVLEDTRDPDCLKTTFSLVKSDVLAKFEGHWDLRVVKDASGKVVGCTGELHQDVLPKGVPPFMARLPVLGGVLRGASVRAVVRVMEDINAAMDKVLAGHAAGRSTEAVLRELCGAYEEAAHANGAVASFAFDAEDADDAEEEDEACKAEKAGEDGDKEEGGKVGGKQGEQPSVEETAAKEEMGGEGEQEGDGAATGAAAKEGPGKEEDEEVPQKGVDGAARPRCEHPGPPPLPPPREVVVAEAVAAGADEREAAAHQKL